MDKLIIKVSHILNLKKLTKNKIQTVNYNKQLRKIQSTNKQIKKKIRVELVKSPK